MLLGLDKDKMFDHMHQEPCSWSYPLCVRFFLSSHKVREAYHQSIVTWKWYIQDGAQATLEDTSKLHEEVAQIPKSSIRVVPTKA